MEEEEEEEERPCAQGDGVARAAGGKKWRGWGVGVEGEGVKERCHDCILTLCAMFGKKHSDSLCMLLIVGRLAGREVCLRQATFWATCLIGRLGA